MKKTAEHFTLGALETGDWRAINTAGSILEMNIPSEFLVPAAPSPQRRAGPPVREYLGERSHAVYQQRTFHRAFRDNKASCFANGNLMPSSIAALIILVAKGCARLTSLFGIADKLVAYLGLHLVQRKKG